jgi:hypothetical protein
MVDPVGKIEVVGMVKRRVLDACVDCSKYSECSIVEFIAIVCSWFSKRLT